MCDCGTLLRLCVLLCREPGNWVSQEVGVPVLPPPPPLCQVGHAPALSLSPPWPSLWPRESPIPQVAEGCNN